MMVWWPEPDKLVVYLQPQYKPAEQSMHLPRVSLLQSIWTVPLEELHLYDFADTAYEKEHLAVWKSTLMDYFCGKDSLLRQCYLLSNINPKKTVTLDFGYVGLASDIQYLRVEINEGKVRYHFTFWRNTHEVSREMSTSRVEVKSPEFAPLLDKIAHYLLDWDDLWLAWYIVVDDRLHAETQTIDL